MKNAFIPYGHQSISESDVSKVSEVLRSEFLTSGPCVEKFELEFADKVGAKFAIAVNSATAALHLAMRVAGVKEGDRVITSPNTFLASANAAAYVGATPDFTDIDRVSHNLDPEELRGKWSTDIKAVVAVDYAGQPCDLPKIANIARANGAVVIEDACHGVGGGFEHNGKIWKIGGHEWADITVFSFHPVKTMTTGEGGMLVTNNKIWVDEVRRLRSHGVERREFFGLGADQDKEMCEKGPWYYEMQSLGYNYRLPDILCALGSSQLSRLECFIAQRREIVAQYNAGLSNIEWLTTPAVLHPGNKDLISWHLYTVEIDFPSIGKNRTEVMRELWDEGIGTQVLYIPVYLQPWYRAKFGYELGKCPVAETHYRKSLSLPLYSSLTTEEVERVIMAIKALGKARKI